MADHRPTAPSPDVVSYMQRHGFPRMTAARKGAGSVEEGIEFLQAHDIVVHPACLHTIDEISLYSYKVDKKTDEVIPVLADKDNHVLDSLRYALKSARRSTYDSTLS
jgi:phage terminase large subunit